MGGWGVWGPASPTGPTGPYGPSGGGGAGGGGASPPPGPPAPPPGGTGAAISKTQCNNKLNLTLLIDNWLIESTLLPMQASQLLVCFYRLIDCKRPWLLAITVYSRSLGSLVGLKPTV